MRLSVDQLKAIVFDIGDTLIDASGIENAGLAYVVARLARLGLAAPDCPLAGHYGSVARRSASPHLNRLFGLPYDVFREASERAHLKPKATLIGHAAYQAFVRRQIKRDWGIVRLFRSLNDLGLRIGIVSDGTTPEQVETLGKLGVLPRVDAVAISDRVGVLKPDPRLFDAALTGLAVQPREALHVGDSWDRDVEGAREFGMTPVYVVRKPIGRRSRKGVPTVALGHLQALLGLLPKASLPCKQR
jgi:HAD superfamily hydrolase (TIGR01549 family)